MSNRSDYYMTPPNMWSGIPNQEQFNNRALEVGTKQARAEAEEAIALEIMSFGEEASE